ncbi:MAG: hypothetical protein EXR43_05865 [Dehalococcoidia bacterium]|nr:hypothetical protein [Dehalococcoidia bacterium]
MTGAKTLVIGAGGLFGRRVASMLAEAGADVCVASLTTGTGDDFQANSIANELWALDRRGRAFVIDASSAEAVARVVRAAGREIGVLTALVVLADRALFPDSALPPGVTPESVGAAAVAALSGAECRTIVIAATEEGAAAAVLAIAASAGGTVLGLAAPTAAEPEEVAAAALRLADPEGAVSGTTLSLR